MSRASRSLSSFSASTSTISDSCRVAPPPIGTRSKVTPSLWMDSTKSMNAGVPMTETVSRRVGAEIHAAQAAAEGLLRENVALRGVGAQADDGGDVAHVPAFLEHEDGDDGLVRRLPGVNLVGFLAQLFQFLLVLAGRGFGNFAVVLGVNDEHRALQFGADLFEIRADVIAVAGVVHHDEQDGFFAERFVFGVALLPFLDAELEVVVVFLGEDGAFLFAAVWRGWRRRAGRDA